MPLYGDKGEWISGDLFKIPPQTLERNQIDEFLDYLFDNMPRKPDPITLREGAAVARYLEAMAIQAGARQGKKARLFSRLSKTIWGTVFRVAPIRSATKRQVTRFLRRHSATYLAVFDVKSALQGVDASELPTDYAKHFQPSVLMSERMSVSGSRKLRLTDDLSERIYAAYYALRRCGIHNARGRIAAALNGRGQRRRARSGSSQLWGSYELNERVKQYEKRMSDRGDGKSSKTAQRYRESLADKWIYLFRT